MKRFLPATCFGLCFLLGLSIGWYFGYTRPSVRDQRKLLEEYRTVRDGFRLSDKEMAEIGAQLPNIRKQMERSDEFAAALALGVFKELEAGKVESAKKHLGQTVSIYYRGHRYDGDTNLLAKIERYAVTNAAISNAIYRKLE
jgi:hypothetical protein